MSDSRNAAEAIPRNYATSVRRGVAWYRERFPRFNSLIPLSPRLVSFFLSLSRFSIPSPAPPLAPRFSLFLPLHPARWFTAWRGGLLPSALTHTRAVTDSADILVPSIPGISLLSNARPNRREPSWLALMDDEGKERVIAERLSLSDSRVLSFGRERKKEKGPGGSEEGEREDKGGGKYRETRRELLGISRAR